MRVRLLAAIVLIFLSLGLAWWFRYDYYVAGTGAKPGLYRVDRWTHRVEFADRIHLEWDPISELPVGRSSGGFHPLEPQADDRARKPGAYDDLIPQAVPRNP